jgi:hypothetical protein
MEKNATCFQLWTIQRSVINNIRWHSASEEIWRGLPSWGVPEPQEVNHGAVLQAYSMRSGIDHCFKFHILAFPKDGWF